MTPATAIHLADLPALLAERGIEIGYRMTVAAPKGAVDANLKRLLQKHKAALVEALARAEAFGNPEIDYSRVLTWDRQLFDWATGEQHRQPGDDGDDGDDKPISIDRADALLGVNGFSRADADDLESKFAEIDPPEPNAPAKPKPTATTPRTKRKPTAGPTLFDAGETEQGKGAT